MHSPIGMNCKIVKPANAEESPKPLKIEFRRLLPRTVRRFLEAWGSLLHLQVGKFQHFMALFLLFMQALCFCVLTMALPLTSQMGESSKNPRSVVILSERDPETNAKIEMKIEKPDAATLKQYAPSAFKTLLNNSWDILKSSGQSFIPEASIFYGASFAVALRQVSLNEEKYPNALANMFAHQIADPVAHFGFLSFLVTHRASNMLFQHLAEKYGLLRNEKQFEKFFSELSRFQMKKKFDLSKDMTKWSQAERNAFLELQKQATVLYPTPQFQSEVNHLKMQTGFVWAFLASTLISDLAHDQNFAYCSMAKYVWGPDRIVKETAKRGMTPTRACDLAWDTWISREKLYDYAPDIASSLAVSVGMALGAPKLFQVSKKVVTRGAEKYWPILLSGFQMVKTIGSYIPQGRVIIMVGNAYVFLEATNILTPVLKGPFESWRQGGKIQELKENLENRLGQNSWLQSLSKECSTLLLGKFSKKILTETPESTLKQWLIENGSYCGEIPLTTLEVLEQYTEKMSKWRQFWFADARQGISNWQSYVSSFHKDIEESYKFYERVLTEFRDENGKKKIGGFIDSKRQFVDPLVAENRIRKAIAVIDNLATLQKKSLSGWRDDILSGNLSKIAIALRKISDQEDIETGLINEFLLIPSNTMQQLRTQLEGLQYVSYGNRKLIELSQETSIFNSEFADVHPASLGRFKVRNRGEYFLLSMLCGPSFGESVIKKIFGVKLNFSAPRVVQDQRGSSKSAMEICNQGISSDKWNASKLFFDVDSQNFQWNGVEYSDLWSFIKENLRPEFVGPDGINRFSEMWKGVVANQMKSEDQHIVKEYQTLLEDVVQPAVERSDSKGYVFNLEEEIYFNIKLLMGSQKVWTEKTRVWYSAVRQKISWIMRLQQSKSDLSKVMDELNKGSSNQLRDMVLDPYQASIDQESSDLKKQFLLSNLLALSLHSDLYQFLTEEKQIENLEFRLKLSENIERLTQSLAESLFFRLALSEANGL